MLPVLLHRTLNNANNVIHYVAAQDLNPDTMGDRQVLQDCYMKLWYFTKLYTLGQLGFQPRNSVIQVLSRLFHIRNSDIYIKQYALRLTGIPTQQQLKKGSP